MSFMRGDLLTRTRKLVNGLAKAEPAWLKAMEQAPPATFPRFDGKVQRITLPEDRYINKFLKKHPNSKHQDALKISDFEPLPARAFGKRVLELKEQGVKEEEAMAVAELEYRADKKEKKRAYARLKKISRILGKKPPPNPYPKASKETQQEERYIPDNLNIFRFVRMMQEDKAPEGQEGQGGRPSYNARMMQEEKAPEARYGQGGQRYFAPEAWYGQGGQRYFAPEARYGQGGQRYYYANMMQEEKAPEARDGQGGRRYYYANMMQEEKALEARDGQVGQRYDYTRMMQEEKAPEARNGQGGRRYY